MRAACLFLCACTVLTQQHNTNAQSLEALSERLRSAIETGDWKQAAALSSSLKTDVISERDRALAKNSTEQISRLIEALPGDTETIVVAQQPFRLTEPTPAGIPDALSAAQSYILSLLAAEDEGKTLKALTGSTLRFGVLAGRKFGHHPPDGSEASPLGLIAYQGCSVYAFANPVQESAFQFQPDHAIGTHPVWTATGKQYTQAADATPREEKYSLTLLQSDLLLACNDQDFFLSTIANWDRSAKGVLFQLPEWKHVDRSAALWGLRHFRSEAAPSDPTNPSNEGLLGEAITGAVGIVFHVGLTSGSVHALWLSTSDENPWKALMKDSQMGSALSVRVPAKGLSELSVNGDKAGADALAIFVIMAYLGFAVIV